MLDAQIRENLALLDPDDDDHWTKAGLPDVEVVSDLVGAKVTRAQIGEAAPDFRREAREVVVESPGFDLSDEPAADAPPEDEPAPDEPESLLEAADGVAAPPEEQPRVNPPDPRAVAAAAIAEKRAEIDAIERAVAEANRRKAELVAEIDGLRAQEAGERLSEVDAFKLYCQRQHESRMARAARSQAVLTQFGVSVPGVDAGLRGGRNSKRHRAAAGAVGVRQRDGGGQ